MWLDPGAPTLSPGQPPASLEGLFLFGSLPFYRQPSRRQAGWPLASSTRAGVWPPVDMSALEQNCWLAQLESGLSLSSILGLRQGSYPQVRGAGQLLP